MCVQTSKKMFVIRLFVWTSESIVVMLVNLSPYKVAMPLKCQQNVFVNLKAAKVEIEKKNYYAKLALKRKCVKCLRTAVDNQTH